MNRLPLLGEWQRALLIFVHRHGVGATVSQFLTGRTIEPGTNGAASAWRAMRVLERRGYVKRTRNGRSIVLTLTDTGAALVSELTGEQPTLFEAIDATPMRARILCDAPKCQRVARAFCASCMPGQHCARHGENRRDRQRRFCWIHAGVSPIEVSPEPSGDRA